jgi:hypothetical protein
MNDRKRHASALCKFPLKSWQNRTNKLQPATAAFAG